MGNVTVIGAQWGDEGKGKIVDWLASRADMVVRFQGGHNAGHTLVVEGKTYKLSLLPSGIVTGTPSVIGNGVVLGPWALKSEIERIREQGIEVTPDLLMVADNCPLILPIHRDLDGLREEGYCVDLAKTVAEAWAHLDAHSYALVISDWRLPDGDGTSIVAAAAQLVASVIDSARVV